MEIDELPSGTQDQKPDIDMNEIVGTHDILMLCFDTLRYDVSVAEEASGGTPVLNSCGNGWEKRHAPGNFTYPSHFAIFAGFLPSPAEPHMLRNRKWLFFPFQAGTGRIPPEGSYAFKEATFVQSLARAGYETICIGGVNFFSKRNDIGRVFPGYFNKSYWLPTFGCTDKNSAANQVDFAVDKLEKYPADRKVFMYINFSAISRLTRGRFVALGSRKIVPLCLCQRPDGQGKESQDSSWYGHKSLRKRIPVPDRIFRPIRVEKS